MATDLLLIKKSSEDGRVQIIDMENGEKFVYEKDTVKKVQVVIAQTS